MTQAKKANLEAATEASGDEPTCAMLSCLLDGELDQGRCNGIFERLRSDPTAMRDWELMNIASDALHSSEVASWHRDDFALRLRVALEAEPTVLAPRRRSRYWRRWVAPGAAVAAAGALVFVGMTQIQRNVDAPGAIAGVTVQQQPVAVAAAVPPAAETPVERLPAMERYLAAHRELARPAVMPDSTPYLRTSATMRIERPSR